MEFIGLVLAIACLALLVVEGAPALYTAVQDSRISHEPPSTGVVEEVVLADSECDKTYITIGDEIYRLDCDGYIPAEGAEVSYHSNGERIFEISPADDEG